MRRPGSISSTRLKCLEKSRMTPGPIALPRLRRAAAPRRDRDAELSAGTDDRDDIRLGSRQHDRQRHDLVDAGIGRNRAPGSADRREPRR